MRCKRCPRVLTRAEIEADTGLCVVCECVAEDRYIDDHEAYALDNPREVSFVFDNRPDDFGGVWAEWGMWDEWAKYDG